MTRIERLTAIILLLQDRPRKSEELAEELRVSRRTVIRDVQSLNLMGLPVLSKDGKDGGYRLPDRFRTRPLDLTGPEAALLMIALEGLAKLADSPFGAHRATLLAKVRAVLPPSSAVEQITSHVGLEVPERRQRATQLDAVTPFVGTGVWLALTYADLDGGRIVQARPDRLFADSGLWYLEVATADGQRLLRVDRISAVAPGQPQSVPESLAYNHPSHPLVRVRLTAKGARQVEREPHIGCLIETRGPQTISFHCPPSELDWYARYFGGMHPEAIIEEPIELIERIRKQATGILTSYPER